MKNFIKKSLKFIFFLIVFFLINSLINIVLIKKQKLTLEKTSILIVGDSHTQKSLNPYYLINSSNISQYAEPYALTLWKLKKIFETYIPDTIIIGFSPHNISQFNEFKFSNSKWANEIFERSYTIMNFHQMSDKIKINKKLLYKKIWKKIALYPQINHISYIGEYSNLKESNLSDVQSVINRHYFTNNKQLNTSNTSIIFLNSILKLCESKKIVIVLLGSPLHSNYLSKVPEGIIKSYDSLLNIYRNEYLVFDYTYNNYVDSLFLDNDHLNEYGAKKFTLELNSFFDK